jgi:triacylglycerol lipase
VRLQTAAPTTVRAPGLEIGMSLRSSACAAAICVLVGAAPIAAADPPLTVPKAKLDAALHCHGKLRGAKRQPVMLVTGTGATGDEAYAIGKGAFDAYRHPVCTVNFPAFTTADIQVSVQYLVNGIRSMTRRAGGPIAIIGISQGGLLPRFALTYWPSLRAGVTDVLAAAGTQHGTTLFDPAGCAANGCAPAVWQQAAGSKLLAALNAQPDETPGPTAWTTVRSTTDEVVQPQTGAHPTSALRGATNIVIQSVCPGRQVSHIGTVLDSVTFAAFTDALAHRGAARIARLPKGVCAHPFATGLDEAGTSAILGASGNLITPRLVNQVPRVTAEPPVRAYAHRTAD